MKIYTLTYDYNRPNQQTITVGTNTDYMIGVAAIKNGELIDLAKDDVTITIGNQTMTADKIVNGYVSFVYAMGRTPTSELATVNITVGGVTTKFDLLIAGKWSTKGDLGLATMPEFETIKFSGTYIDGTTFDYNVVID